MRAWCQRRYLSTAGLRCRHRIVSLMRDERLTITSGNVIKDFIA
jgi:hypothetical protein